jgi:short-subunit dehydrogenase
MTQAVALITGCSSGIGRALAEAFRTANYQVWATARKTEDVAALQAAGFKAVQLDVNSAEDISRLVSQLQADSGRLDVLINNAGYGAMGPLLDGGAPAMRDQFETNLFSLVAITQACFPLLRESRGLVVNISSVSGVLVTPFAGTYCASKAAVHAMSDALRLELHPFGVRVMEVQPGAIQSSFGSNATQSAEQLISESSPWWPLRNAIRARANASQKNPTLASEFASDLLKAAQRKNPPRLLRLGNGSKAMPLTARWLPKALLERNLRKRFGLNRQL